MKETKEGVVRLQMLTESVFGDIGVYLHGLCSDIRRRPCMPARV